MLPCPVYNSQSGRGRRDCRLKHDQPAEDLVSAEGGVSYSRLLNNSIPVGKKDKSSDAHVALGSVKQLNSIFHKKAKRTNNKWQLIFFILNTIFRTYHTCIAWSSTWHKLLYCKRILKQHLYEII